MFVKAQNVSSHGLHSDSEFYVDASELRLPPGEFPDTMQTDIGNQLPFSLSVLDNQKAVYIQIAGCVKLTVFND
jgi:hypothetical protein